MQKKIFPMNIQMPAVNKDSMYNRSGICHSICYFQLKMKSGIKTKQYFMINIAYSACYCPTLSICSKMKVNTSFAFSALLTPS